MTQTSWDLFWTELVLQTPTCACVRITFRNAEHPRLQLKSRGTEEQECLWEIQVFISLQLSAACKHNPTILCLLGFTVCLLVWRVFLSFIHSNLMVYSKKTTPQKCEEDVLELFFIRTIIFVKKTKSRFHCSKRILNRM